MSWIVGAKSPRFTEVCAQWAAFDRLLSDKLCPLHERWLLAGSCPTIVSAESPSEGLLCLRERIYRSV